MSQKNVEHDHWEADFNGPEKVDVILIKWKAPPKRFRVFIKIDDNSEFIPVTEIVERDKFSGEQNAIVFNQPIIAKRIRINLHETTKERSFSIFYVQLFQKRTTLLIKNALIDDTQHYCFYVNTSLPAEDVPIEAYPCLKAIVLGDNNELFIYFNDRSIRHFNSRLCVGFDKESSLVLKPCGDYNPVYTIQFNNSNNLYFTGYEKNCLYIQKERKISSNMVTDETEVIVTTEADSQTFKKENIKCIILVL
jgi:hypothetical protein